MENGIINFFNSPPDPDILAMVMKFLSHVKLHPGKFTYPADKVIDSLIVNLKEYYITVNLTTLNCFNIFEASLNYARILFENTHGTKASDDILNKILNHTLKHALCHYLLSNEEIKVDDKIYILTQFRHYHIQKSLELL